MAALNTFRTDGEDFGEQILSKVVKAGRRTYFLDVRATRANDYFLTITESRKKTAPDIIAKFICTDCKIQMCIFS